VCLISFYDKDTLVKNDISLEKQAKDANIKLFLEKDKISFEFALME